MAKLKDYKLIEYPEQKSFLDKFGSNFNVEMKTRAIKSELGDNYKYYEQIKGATQMMRTPQTRLPYDIMIN